MRVKPHFRLFRLLRSDVCLIGRVMSAISEKNLEKPTRSQGALFIIVAHSEPTRTLAKASDLQTAAVLLSRCIWPICRVAALQFVGFQHYHLQLVIQVA